MAHNAADLHAKFILVVTDLLKRCADPLSSILCIMFNLSLFQCKISETWKMSCIVPVQKKTSVVTLNDLRPVALPSAVMKVFKRVVLKNLKVVVEDFLDHFQFACRAKRSVNDAVLLCSEQYIICTFR